MPDLHGWISQKIDAVEECARACPPWPWTFDTDDDAVIAADGIQVADVFALSSKQLRATGLHVIANDPEAVLRRCAADRKILARHSVDPALSDDRLWATACNGCGSDGDCDDPVTENINDCPELLDLAWAHGMNTATIATLDRPQPPDWKPAPKQPMRAMRSSDVPAALRGPSWKAKP